MTPRTLPLCPTSDYPTRRHLLRGAASAALVTAAADAALAQPAAVEPDPHPAWLAALDRLHHDDRTIWGRTNEEVEALVHEMTRLEKLIGSTPSRTLAGAMAQLRMAYGILSDDGSVNLDRDTDALESAIATLERLLPGSAGHV